MQCNSQCRLLLEPEGPSWGIEAFSGLLVMSFSLSLFNCETVRSSHGDFFRRQALYNTRSNPSHLVGVSQPKAQ